MGDFVMQKVWFITGCSKGFGHHLTEELLKSTDANVVATARKPDALKEEFKQFEDRLLVIKLDVTKQTEIDQAVKDALSRFHRIDVLVNNAGYGLLGALEECTMEDIRTLYDTNVFGLMAMTKAVLPHMRGQGAGHIFNFSSIAGLAANPGSGLYSSTKFAVEGLSEALSAEVAQFGIKVTIIEPGPFRTDFAGDSIRLAPALAEYDDTPANKFRGYIKHFHNKQVGDPEKAARIIIHLNQMQDPPLRMLLGNPAIDRIHDKLDKFQAEMLKNEPITRSADFD
jgi:NADP-dependent 3-hydroxy acid dehydrogenase YdfG